MLITRLLLVLDVWDGKPTYRKSWAGNLLAWSDLTLGPLLEGQMRTAKLKSAYNLLIIGPRGFGALSLRWIQFAWVFRCARSSFLIYFIISRRALAREGDYAMMPVCVCVRACVRVLVSHADSSKTTTATDFL